MPLTVFNRNYVLSMYKDRRVNMKIATELSDEKQCLITVSQIMFIFFLINWMKCNLSVQNGSQKLEYH